MKAMLDKSDGPKGMPDALSTMMTTPPQTLDPSGVSVIEATDQEKKQEESHQTKEEK